MDIFESADVRCLFQLGTPLQPYAVVENSVDGSLAIVRITPEIFTFFQNAGVSTCQPMTLPPDELASLNPHCIFQVFIGAQQPASFALIVDPANGDISIVQIPSTIFCFFDSLGIPECQIFDLSDETNSD